MALLDAFCEALAQGGEGVGGEVDGSGEVSEVSADPEEGGFVDFLAVDGGCQAPHLLAVAFAFGVDVYVDWGGFDENVGVDLRLELGREREEFGCSRTWLRSL